MSSSSTSTLWQSVTKPIRKWQERRRFRQESRTDVFRYIYETNRWGCDESRSGKGSDMTQTERLRDALPALLKELSVTSILDLPCGDMNWITTLDLSGYAYTGADIVPDLIARNKEAHPQLAFTVLDICEEALPSADLLLSRDLFVHLSFADIEKALANVSRSSIRYLACTTFPNVTKNEDKLTGNHRKLNMSIEPLGFGEPDFIVADSSYAQEPPEKYLGVWEVERLRGRRADT
jgi:SAM-dependent methyltransferase